MRKEIRILPPCLLITNKITKLTAWLTTVASAAPATPMSKVKISTGSSTIFSAAPVTIPTIA